VRVLLAALAPPRLPLLLTRTPRVHLHQQHLLLLQHRQHRLRHHLLGQLLRLVQESSTSS
jgi:hypothetical protein